MQRFAEKRTGVRGTERIKEASHLQRLIFHFQPNLQSTGKHACRENAKEGEAVQWKAKLEFKRGRRTENETMKRGGINIEVEQNRGKGRHASWILTRQHHCM